MSYVEVRRHTMRVKPGQNLSQAGVDRARKVGDQIGPFARVISSDIPRAFQTALAMGFAVDEELAELGTATGIVWEEINWDAGCAEVSRIVAAGGDLGRAAGAMTALWRRIAADLPDNGAALLISHGGYIEVGAVASMPAADHASWGPAFDYCEGVRLHYHQGAWTGIEILRLDDAAGG